MNPAIVNSPRHPVPRHALRALLVALTSLLVATIAQAPHAAAGTAAVIDHIVPITDRWLRVFVRSPAMGRTVQVDVLLPAHRDHPRPTVYLLEGIDSERSDQNDWTATGGAVGFFADKDVDVVLPVGGAGSYYTDWQRDDPVRGRQRWETMLTGELPPLLDARFGGNGNNAIAGISMGAQAAVILAERSGALFRAVAALSGCYDTGDLVGQAELRYIVGTDGSDPDDMWGAPNAAGWAAHDALAHADRLAGKALYFYAATGLPGPHENPATPDLPDDVFAGGPIEFGTRLCTQTMRHRLAALGIPATYDLAAAGTHSWPYWREQLAASWPVLAAGIAGTRR